MKHIALPLLLACTLSTWAALYAQPMRTSSAVIDCDRACLYDIADRYLDALVKGDSSRAPLARELKFTENGVQLQIGDGLWNTISALRGYDLKVADPAEGQVAVIDVVEEHGVPGILALRLKVLNREIVEVETVLSRKVDNSPFPVTDSLVAPNPLWSQDIARDRRQPRARLISVADGYFDTLQLNDGTLFTQFTDDCDRVENGLLTTNNPDIPDYDIAQMGCEEQFRLGQYIYDDRLRDRRYPLVDEEKGVVLAAGFMDHTGRVYEFEWTDGTPQTSIFFYPHSFIYLELFKVENNAIRLVESVFSSMPYNMPSVW